MKLDTHLLLLKQCLNLLLFLLILPFLHPLPLLLELLGIDTIEHIAEAIKGSLSSHTVSLLLYIFSDTLYFVMFLLSSAYALRLALYPHIDNALYNAIWPLTAGAYLMGLAYLVSLRVLPYPELHLLFIIVAFGCLVTAFVKAVHSETPLTAFDRGITLPVLGLLSGALTFSLWAAFFDMLSPTAANQGYTLLSLLPSGGIALWVIYMNRGYFWFTFSAVFKTLGVLITCTIGDIIANKGQLDFNPLLVGTCSVLIVWLWIAMLQAQHHARQAQKAAAQ